MAIRNSFANVTRNILSRNFGGTVAGVADPYVTGYHFIHFARLPSALTEYAGIDNVSQLTALLSGACLSVTPPGGTLNKVEFTGLGGVKWSVPGNIDYGNSVSIKFLEFNGTPILNIMHGWVKMIRDYRTGTSNLVEDEELVGYSKSTYAAFMYYWTTAPDSKTVEYYAAYDGMFPTKDPQDLFTSDVETIGRLDLEIEFNTDYVWHEDWVKDRCQSLSDTVFATKADIIEKYGEDTNANL
ncbi:MAG: hypothetical protein PVG65_00380 [Candidatus Thorarchaeota archaeon]|jgi:hypothetical protein